jgi:hypothetical protein
MARGGHGLPKVPLGSAMTDPTESSRRATPETALRPFQGWHTCKAGGLRPHSTPMFKGDSALWKYGHFENKLDN